MRKEKIIVCNAKPERKFFKTYYDFLYNNVLNGDEKLVFVILKSFLDFSMDKNGTNGKVFPTIKTICKITKWGNKKVIKVINSLIEKNVVKKIRRGLNKPNVYVLSDYAEIWAAQTLDEIKEIVENDGVKPMTAEEHIAELKKMGYDVQITEKENVLEKPIADKEEMTIVIKETISEEVVSEDVEIKEKEFVSDNDQDTDTNPNQTSFYENDNTKENHNTKIDKSQPLQTYSLDFLKEKFNYSAMVDKYHNDQDKIDSVFNIIYTTVNATNKKIRISGDKKPIMVVKSKFLKLEHEDIIYAIGKFLEQTDKIKNPIAYMTTLLYNAHEQRTLEMANSAQHDKAHKNEKPVESNQYQQQYNQHQNDKNQFNQFMQREVTQEELDELERRLLRHGEDEEDKEDNESNESKESSKTEGFIPVSEQPQLKTQKNDNKKKPKNKFHQFHQREVTQEELDELERKLLKR